MGTRICWSTQLSLCFCRDILSPGTPCPWKLSRVYTAAAPQGEGELSWEVSPKGGSEPGLW